LTRTYIHAWQGTPVSQYFATHDGTFAASFILDNTVTAPTEIYINSDTWYQTGYKLIASWDGHAIGDVTFEHVGKNYVQVVFSDAYASSSLNKYNGKKIDILITPPLLFEGKIPSSANYTTAYSTTDNGSSGKCDFAATFADEIPKDIVYHIVDRDGNRKAEISQSQPSASLNCFEVAEGQLMLVRLASSFLKPTEVLMSTIMTGFNGMATKLDLTVDPQAAF